MNAGPFMTCHFDNGTPCAVIFLSVFERGALHDIRSSCKELAARYLKFLSVFERGALHDLDVDDQVVFAGKRFLSVFERGALHDTRGFYEFIAAGGKVSKRL